MDLYIRGTLRFFLALLTLLCATCHGTCPSSCVCNLKGAVLCVGYSVTDIPNQLPVHTYLLWLNETVVTVIGDRSLANKNLLLRFSLTFSHLHTIHPQAFHVSPQLKSIKLSYNNLSAVPAQVFRPLTALEQLHLNGNQLQTIAPDMFKGLAELKELDMSRNKLTSPASGVFDDLTNLTFLNLGRNSIKTLQPGIFRSLTKLQQLMLYYNELEVIDPGIFDELINLEELKMHQNKIASLPPRVFWSLKNLKVLTLSANRLKALPEKTFYNMPKLNALTLYTNPLLFLPDQLMGHMPEIKEFYLYGTKLTTVPANLFANMSGLMSLNLHLNENLRQLPLDLFCCLPNLQKLSLKSNQLSYLHPKLFSKLSTVKTLLLNDNQLGQLPNNIFQGLHQVVTIDLKRSNLRTLPGDIFLSNTVLRALSLGDNPWDCTCSIKPIMRWIKQNEHVVTDKDDVMCQNPLYQALRLIVSLREEEILCPGYDLSELYEPTQLVHTILTSEQKSIMVSTNTHPETIRTIQGAAQTSNTPTTNPPANSPHSVTSVPPKGNSLDIAEAGRVSSFHGQLVLQQGPEFIHHNFYQGWVYVWFLPSDVTGTGVLMFCHILLVATGLFLVVAVVYGMYRLNKCVDKLKGERANASV